jgi:hypothetical protein
MELRASLECPRSRVWSVELPQRLVACNSARRDTLIVFAACREFRDSLRRICTLMCAQI